MAGSAEQAGAQATGAGAAWGAIASGFQQADAQLVGINGQQTDLQRAVLAGELWMDADVAEKAAKRCDQAVQGDHRVVERRPPAHLDAQVR